MIDSKKKENTLNVELPVETIQKNNQIKQEILGAILDKQIVDERAINKKIIVVDRCDFSSQVYIPSDKEGVESYLIGALYPFKGYLYPEVVHTVHLVKRNLRIIIEILSFRPIAILLSFFSVLPSIKYKIVKHIIDRVIFWANTALKDYYIYPNRFCRSGRELFKKAISFNKNPILERLARIACMIWEYDNSYRYRGQDLFGELNIQNLQKNPRRELLRVWNIGIEREGDENTKNKRELFGKVIYFIPFFYPKLFKAFVSYLKTLDFNEVKLDEGDIYDCARRDLYNFQGKPLLDRIKVRIQQDFENNLITH